MDNYLNQKDQEISDMIKEIVQKHDNIQDMCLIIKMLANRTITPEEARKNLSWYWEAVSKTK